MKNTCPNCNKEISSRNKYCNNKCQSEYEHKQYIKRWKEGKETGLKGIYGLSNHIRKYLLKKYHNKCCKCGWNEINLYINNIPLEIHHIDGDYTNNSEENLEVLCPNCHSLTETFKNHNTKGRKDRKKYNI